MPCCALVMELNRIIFLAGFLVNIKLSRMSPSRLPCDQQMISKYVSDCKTLENEATNCRNASPVTETVQFPLVGIKNTWSTIAVERKGKEILSHLKVFVEAVNVARMHQQNGCVSDVLSKLSQSITEFQLIVKNLCETEKVQLEDMPSTTKSEWRIQELFHRFHNLVRGKLAFFLNNLCKTNCTTPST